MIADVNNRILSMAQSLDQSEVSLSSLTGEQLNVNW